MKNVFEERKKFSKYILIVKLIINLLPAYCKFLVLVLGKLGQTTQGGSRNVKNLMLLWCMCKHTESVYLLVDVIASPHRSTLHWLTWNLELKCVYIQAAVLSF